MDTTPNQEDPSFTAGTMTGEEIGSGPTPRTEPLERLHRLRHGRMVAGVAGGLADYFDVDPTIVRIGFVALTLLGGLAVPVYAAGWLLIPCEGESESLAEELLHREWDHR
ncbi:MAG TPA: PspC domain-containing protein [Acidimicrobiales bacterium]|jgi:phage shock protein PspC (stress-responsive transcriptional regulator)